MPVELHVRSDGSDETPDGSEQHPFASIDAAAQVAQPGDTVLVHAGVYREWVSPRFSGLSDHRRITYAAAPGEHVVIKGSEQVTGWRREDGSVWTVDVPNSLFGDFNPFAEEVDGDWIVYADPSTPKKHLGDVYLNGLSFYEVTSRAELADPPRRTEVHDDWTKTPDHVRDPDQTQLVWFAEVGDESTTVWANFGDADPNAELVEVNVRRSVFYPREHHVDYITVRGFELCQAATPWAPPTADQPGLIGPNWAKGWVIEDNVIHDAKCSAISIGKEASTGHNFATVRGDKPGYQYQLESVFTAAQTGWDREHIGSHVIRRNTIFDCGQNGIVGHLGCVFSTIEDNHIYNIAIKREFYGYEIGGIKLHAALDVVIRHNHIHDCSLGTWLDWQTQGTRVSRNVYHDNKRDLFVEVSHGPYLVDHNLFASPVSLESFSQGGAYVNNLVVGTVWLSPVLERPTPYHVPHSTQVAGYAAIMGGDDRFVGNVFLGGDTAAAYGTDFRFPGSAHHGTAGYDGHPSSMEEYRVLIGDPTKGDHERFTVPQPVYIHDNVYLGGAEPYAAEQGAVVLEGDVSVRVVTEGDAVHLETRLPEGFGDTTVVAVSGADLPPVRFVDADFDDPDGRPAVIDADLVGQAKDAGQRYAAGPLLTLKGGSQRTQVW
ncbi:right-handed parallel beta-helix repeat-containing protein [Microlunatus spumicola]|uniref:right-handed parallel beta-helix repeat-containing protein n=1 Tax=Microlunatus spumicola TaxID=81499 RepID=UPI0019569E43